jgi:tetratricopeptide (TPR) repeat protein
MSLSTNELFQQALQHLKSNELRLAEKCYLQIIEQDPSNPEGYNNLGALARARNELELAKSFFEKAFTVDPLFYRALHNYGKILHIQNELELAKTYYQRSIDLQPSFAIAYNDLGVILQIQNHFVEAQEKFQQAIKLNPNYADAYNNLGIAFHKQKFYPEAIECYQEAISLNPNFSKAYNNLGITLYRENKPEEAKLYFDVSADIDPNCAETYYYLGMIAWDYDDEETAEQHFQKALELDPLNANLHQNLGYICYAEHKFEQARKAYLTALEIDPQNYEVKKNLSHLLLTLGEWDQGWELYEWRLKGGETIINPREFTVPRWAGENLDNKTLLIQGEQGYGDVIFFARFIPFLKQKYQVKIIFEIQPALRKLCECIEGVDCFLDFNEPLPGFDYHTPLMSIPLSLQLKIETIPPFIPYITSDTTYDRLLPSTQNNPNSKVGVVWACNQDSLNAKARTCPFDIFKEIFSATNCEFYGLQVGEKAKFLQDLHLSHVHDLSPQLVDFTDTAKAIMQLNLIVTIDTSVAHLAAAMGKPVWLLHSYTPEWRWLLDRTDSPWYPTVRIFRQPKMHDWQSIIQEVTQLLKGL